jgi:NAD(P)-dependent dehydrogenase (short-subunit alcohol dehydrogenase family)
MEAGGKTMSDHGKLGGKVAVVTGASRGLGAAVAAAFQAEGAAVARASRSSGVDVTKSPEVQRFFSETAERHGRIDIVVSNAGILTPRRPLVEVTDEEWRASLAVNLSGVFYCLREALRRMVPRGEGLIINVSSGVTHHRPPRWGPYAAAKWGVEGLTQVAAAELEGSGVKVVAIDPGATRTAMRAAAHPDEDPQSVKTAEEAASFFLAVAAGEIPFASGARLVYPET